MVSSEYVLACLLHYFLVLCSLRSKGQNLLLIDPGARASLDPFSSPMIVQTTGPWILFLLISCQALLDSFLQHSLSCKPIRSSELVSILNYEGLHLCLCGRLRVRPCILQGHFIQNHYDPAISLKYALLAIYVLFYENVALVNSKARFL